MSHLASTISASQARRNFYTLLDEVSKGLRRFTITRRGEAQMVLMHPDEVVSWEETMEIMANKKLMAQLLKSKQEKMKDKVSQEEVLKELGIDPRDLE